MKTSNLPKQVNELFANIKIFNLIMILLTISFISCQKDLQNLCCPEKPGGNTLKTITTQEVPLINAQNITVGSVSTTYNAAGDQLTITYAITNSSYWLVETHLDVQIDPANFPQSSSGNPKVKQFAYGANLGNAPSWTQVVDLTIVSGWSYGSIIYVAANAVVKSIPGGTKEAWGDGLPFPCNNWAMYFICYPPLTAEATATPSEIYTGESSQLDILASGGTGVYNYSWTSNPVGFTSVLQNPTVTPSTTTTYTCIVTSDNQIEEATVIVTLLPPLWVCGESFFDNRDGKSYNTVQIGSQCWFQENLNTGTMIDGGLNQTDNSIIEKYCNSDNEANCDIYGGLYQWNEMMQFVTTEGVQGICPTGWHIPSDNEVTTLTTFLGGVSVAGGKLKSTGTVSAGTGLWNDPNTDATNESGFTALPSGARDPGIYYYGFHYVASFWTSSQTDDTYAWFREISYSLQSVNLGFPPKLYGFSVRCIKD